MQEKIEKKKFNLKTFFALLGAFSMSALAVVVALVPKNEKPSYAIDYYGDNGIVLTPYELNNIKFEEVADILNVENPNYTDSYVVYNGYRLNYDALEDFVDYKYINYYFADTTIEYNISFTISGNGSFYSKGLFNQIYILNNEEYEGRTFEHSLYIYNFPQMVSAFKQSTITFNANELNYNTYSVLANNIDSYYTSQLGESVAIYENSIYLFDAFDAGDLVWEQNSYRIVMTTNSDGSYPLYKFSFFDADLDETVPFTNPVTFYNASYIVNNITSTYDGGDYSVQGFVEILFGGITGTASAIGVGLSTLVNDLAIQGSTMSAFMSIILIFGSIALALGIGRWVVNLLTSLGQRNK